jgi:hypothetical protein
VKIDRHSETEQRKITYIFKKAAYVSGYATDKQFCAHRAAKNEHKKKAYQRKRRAAKNLSDSFGSL